MILRHCLLLDLETSDQVIRELGAVFGAQELRLSRKQLDAEGWRRLDGFAGQARFVAGHNVLAHDLPHLATAAPGLRLLRLPVLDTLVLSPLAFPENPYHPLVKDYKPTRSSSNDPVADAHEAGALLAAECEALRVRHGGEGGLARLGLLRSEM